MSRRARILVTRSEPGASETAERLTARGFEPLVEPFLSVRHLTPRLPGFDALAFTSANGVRAFAPLSQRRECPVYCVGARTAEAARAAGFADVKSADGDVAALITLICAQLQPNARLLHSGNRDARGDLTATLARTGHAAAFVATYNARARQTPGPALAAHLAGGAGLDAVLIHSPAAARILDGFLDAAPGAPDLAVAAISANALPVKRGGPARAAGHPDEASLLATLESLLNQA